MTRLTSARIPLLTFRRWLRGKAIHRTDELQNSPTDPFACGPVSRKTDISGEYLMSPEKKKEVRNFWDSVHRMKFKMDNEPVVQEITAGVVRRDSDNQPRYHGQFSEDNTRLALDDNVYDQLIRSRVSPDKKAADSPIEETIPIEASASIYASEMPENMEVDIFFPNRESFDPNECKGIGIFEFKTSDHWFENPNRWGKKDMNGRLPPSRYGLNEMGEPDVTVMAGLQLAKESPIKSLQDIEQELSEIEMEMSTAKADPETSANDSVGKEDKPSPEAEQADGVLLDRETESPKDMTAYEYVTKLRRGELEPESEVLKTAFERTNANALDSQGFNSYIGYVPDLTQFRRSELLWALKNSIIFCDSDVLAINKPYGLIVEGKERVEDTRAPVLSDLLEDFAALLLEQRIISEPKKLQHVHRLDKETTGVLVLAMSDEKALFIRKLFQDRQVIKVYRTITRSTPDPAAGIIDIPIEAGHVDRYERMVLRPELREEYRRFASPRQQAKKAVTEYKVVSRNRGAASVEVRPVTGVKHQIRVHLGFGMRCPVLGDHKYTYLNRIAPQKLPPDMLKALNVRQAKVRNIPMHLLCKMMSLPGAGSEGRTIHLKANTPAFFRKTLQRLKLK